MKNNIRIMSYNIHSGIGADGRYDLERLAAVIRESDAEIVGLQEVDVHWGSRSLHEHTARLLAEKLNMQLYYAPIYDLTSEQAGNPNRQFGNAILSKFPFQNTANHQLTRLSTQNSSIGPALMPGLAEAFLSINGVEIALYVTHLDYRKDPALRQKQVAEMLEIMACHSCAKIVLGDFNATPDAPELSALFSNFKDTWIDNEKAEAGFTFPSDVPDRKIDYILTSTHFQTEHSEIIESQASDHYPIIADVKLFG